MIIINFIRTWLRRAAHIFAAFLNRVSGGAVHPDHITIFGLAMHLPIAFLIAHGDFIWAAALLFFFGLFDAVDGELARMQQRVSVSGMLLDASTDRIKEMLVYAGIAYWITTGGHPTWAYLAVLACGLAMTTSYIKAKGEVAYAVVKHSNDHQSLNRHFKESLAPFEVRMGILLAGLVTGLLVPAVILNLALALISVPILLASVMRQTKDRA